MQKFRKGILIPGLILVFIFFNNCSQNNSPSGNQSFPVFPPEPSNSLSLPLKLNRLSSSQFEIVIDAATLLDFSPADIQLTIANATATTFLLVSGSTFKATVTAQYLSGEIPFTVSWKNYSTTRTALIFPTVDASWDQPEAVPGMVNTDGWEDSPEISPDGNFLAVSTYSPVSLFKCIIDNLSLTAPSCNNNSFASLSSERPNFGGATRILSSTSINHNVSWANPPSPTALPPVGAYVFEKQADGTFANPIHVGLNWEGYTWGAPFGFNFRRKISDKNYEVYFAFGDPLLSNGNKLQKTQMDFSQSSISLGRLALVTGTPTKSNWAMTPLSIPGLTTQAGNPGSSWTHGGSNGYLFWDDESLPGNTSQREIFFATENSDGVLGSKQTAAISPVGVDKYQPYYFQNRLYMSLFHGMILSSELSNGGDPAQSGSWSNNRVELAIDTGHTHEGRFNAIGEPSLYVDEAGKKWLYFAYGTATTATLNLNIGRVSAK
jgi:hypothetical protein